MGIYRAQKRCIETLPSLSLPADPAYESAFKLCSRVAELTLDKDYKHGGAHTYFPDIASVWSLLHCMTASSEHTTP